MKKILGLLISVSFILPLSVNAQSEMVCPSQESNLPEGSRFLWACYEVSNIEPDRVGEFVESIQSADPYTPESFDTYRDAIAFEWFSTSRMGSRTTVTSRRQEGYVITAEGERREGTIQLRVRNLDIDRITLRENRDRTRFDPEEIQAFGLSEADEYRANLRERLSPGRVSFIDGTTIDANLRFMGPGLLMFQGEGNRVIRLVPSEVDSFSIETADANLQFLSKSNAFISLIQSGEHFSLAYNPNPQPIQESRVGRFLKNTLTSAVIGEIGGAIAESAGSIDAFLLIADATNQAQSAALMYDPEKFRTEYLLINNQGGADIVVYEENFADTVEATLNQCESFTAKNPTDTQPYMNLDSMATIAGWFNECAAEG